VTHDQTEAMTMGDRVAVMKAGILQELDAPKVVTADTKLLDKDPHTDDVPTHEIEGTKFVAAFAPRSRVKVGDQIEVVVDTERMHFFDPETGLAIRG
jgi:multiple sugar transport system ATP-binding protein